MISMTNGHLTIWVARPWVFLSISALLRWLPSVWPNLHPCAEVDLAPGGGDARHSQREHAVRVDGAGQHRDQEQGEQECTHGFINTNQ